LNISADGVVNPYGKVFNKTYPGPWIQACWGDMLEITVKNDLPFNGTTIHWHGLRQLGTLEMDGVNGVTQCPIAPGESYTYRFRAMQYGTSWYHSHYSLQYGDGLLGPLTIFGPSSASYDEAKDPILMTDWNHRSGFQDFQTELDGSGPPKMTSILLNGLGSYAGGARDGLKYNTTFERGKRYLMRLINTSVETTFIFAIDNHNITVISSDFVPIKPYVTNHVVIGIGQRYHVVVEANPFDSKGNPETPRGEYWMRTIPANNCSTFELGGIPDERQGIVYYEKGSKAYPTTPRAPSIPLDCRDEPFPSLVPVLPWTVKKVQRDEIKDLFEVGIQNTTTFPGHPLPTDHFARWAIGKQPLYINFSDPTILNLDNTTFSSEYVVIPQDVPQDAWVYLIITSTDVDAPNPDRQFVPAAHPIHLHGHDFALLQQSNELWNGSNFNPKYDNPPRRDVVLLPANGFVIIAFRADNPGAWLLHCHIAWHASSGLALQILERQEAADSIFTPDKLGRVNQGCRKWRDWFSEEKNFWNPEGGVGAFQDDSGI